MRLICNRFIKNIVYLSSIFIKRELHNVSNLYKHCHCYKKSYRSFSTVDTLDELTVRLINKNGAKLNSSKCTEEDISFLSSNTSSDSIFKSKWKLINISKKTISNGDRFTVDQIDSLINIYLKECKWNEVENILDYCVYNKVSPNENVMLELFRYHSMLGDIDVVSYLQNVCKSVRSNYNEKHSDFDYFLAIAYWKRGNIDNAFLLLEKTYLKNCSLRKILFQIYKLLINDVIKNSSEAAVVNLRKHVEYFQKTHDKHFMIFLFWESCWLSEWYRDHLLAESLLKQHDFLPSILWKKCSLISVLALKDYNEDAVRRLLQLLLKYKRKHEYCLVIRNLFDHQYKIDDYHGCLETLENCKRLKIQLTKTQYDVFLNKFHGKPMETIKPSTPLIMKF